MNDLAIVIFSCDKNEELWPICHHFINKYWPNHPNIYLLTESVKSPLFNTISIPYELDKWTIRIRESLKTIKENKVIFICDDCFINDTVNINKLEECMNILNGLPCLDALVNYSNQDQRVVDKIKYTISFFCAGVPSDRANEKLLDK